ncbi:MAG: hypothetical protein Q8Q85_01415 [Gemmatimonadales bacterium]|nr:hypothetical protein [Gemmatimonadales bacterium]
MLVADPTSIIAFHGSTLGMVIIQAQLRAVGVQMDILPLEFGAVLRREGGRVRRGAPQHADPRVGREGVLRAEWTFGPSSWSLAASG